MPAIDFDKETLGSILRAKQNLKGSVNQRSYLWKEEHVSDLYKDLMRRSLPLTL